MVRDAPGPETSWFTCSGTSSGFFFEDQFFFVGAQSQKIQKFETQFFFVEAQSRFKKSETQFFSIEPQSRKFETQGLDHWGGNLILWEPNPAKKKSWKRRGDWAPTKKNWVSNIGGRKFEPWFLGEGATGSFGHFLKMGG